MTSLDFSTILPEVVLAAYALAALMAGSYLGKDRLAPTLLWTTVGVLLLIAAMIGMGGRADATSFHDMFIDDGFSRFSKVVMLIAGAAVMAVSADYMQRRNMLRFEFPILVALSVLGMMFMVSAGDLLTLYMGLELQSLALYVVAAMRRDSVRSSEAGLKYFVLGSLSSGLLLYGASLVYGFAGTTNFAGIITVVQDGRLSLGVLFGLVFMLVGLAFKVSAVPFHMWTPDVYEGSPTPVTAFFATAPKVAAMALIARLVFDAFGQVIGDWSQIVAALAVMSMFLGSIAGIGQTNIKRLMAYSSIAHMGFALVGLAAGTGIGVQAMLLYMAIYAVMNVGTFAFILSMERDGVPVTDLASLNRFAWQEPVKGLAMLVLLFSLAGVPPTLGFFAKFGVLTAAVDAGLGWLALLGVIASVIGAFYYLRIVYYMYFGAETEGVSSRMGVVQYLGLMLPALIMLLGAINMFGVDSAAGRAAETLVGPAMNLDQPAEPAQGE
ncbi:MULTISPECIES: NADH-quinone oxidoreductase subunit NuoN [unclassified Paracoccus (in: a-proteobacteria)]|uniref:NADH-quinone oxidoreductase subunit NuoN n=1 Tax=unclassified Paracoccus (in: a-proteobacteria) TaxID=2688777 RepID=UPI0012B3B302|nr:MULTISPECIES: NADH-quinone oxidoreductase subunit NuoN [unclassified Paracoccus (in: a-proteobacteria)]UXU75201.1 NADH-quinone oxidoreductase subunit NuoN [Paracoccus sp. SMMA_5]UXU81103.1 NADH-quinone oxidoreductase subunit NuoN [Paracoccus sp. SMMA_5_TC]